MEEKLEGIHLCNGIYLKAKPLIYQINRCQHFCFQSLIMRSWFNTIKIAALDIKIIKDQFLKERAHLSLELKNKIKITMEDLVMRMSTKITSSKINNLFKDLSEIQTNLCTSKQSNGKCGE
jgi:hypothetical protein